MATEIYPIDPYGRGDGSTLAGIIIDGVCYRLEGEPAPYPPSVHLTGNGQR